LLAYPKGYNIGLVLMVISVVSTLVLFVKRKKNDVNNRNKVLFFIMFSYFVSFLLSFAFSDGSIKELGNPLKSLLFFFVIIFLLNQSIRNEFTLYAIPVGAFMAGCTAIFQRFYLNYTAAFELQMKIQAGDMAMSLAMYTLVIGIYFLIRKAYWVAIFSLLSVILAIFASLLSGSRGGWIGVPIILFIIFLLYYKFFNKMIISSLIASAVILLASVFSSGIYSQISDRINNAFNDIEQYITQNNTVSSNGARFNMWEGAILAFKEKPILGWGAKGMEEYRKELVNTGVLNKANLEFNHAHNQYLDALSKRGIIGFLTLLAIFLYPLYFFSHSIKANRENFKIRLWGSLGIVHTLSVMIYCLTQSFFEHNSGNIFYFFVLMLFMAFIRNEENYHKYNVRKKEIGNDRKNRVFN